MGFVARHRSVFVWTAFSVLSVTLFSIYALSREATIIASADTPSPLMMPEKPIITPIPTPSPTPFQFRNVFNLFPPVVLDNEANVAPGSLEKDDVYCIVDGDSKTMRFALNAAIGMKHVGCKKVIFLSYDQDGADFAREVGFLVAWNASFEEEVSNFYATPGCYGHLGLVQRFRTQLGLEMHMAGMSYVQLDGDLFPLKDFREWITGEYHMFCETHALVHSPLNYVDWFPPFGENVDIYAVLNNGFAGYRITRELQEIYYDWFHNYNIKRMCVDGYAQYTWNQYMYNLGFRIRAPIEHPRFNCTYDGLLPCDAYYGQCNENTRASWRSFAFDATAPNSTLRYFLQRNVSILGIDAFLDNSTAAVHAAGAGLAPDKIGFLLNNKLWVVMEDIETVARDGNWMTYLDAVQALPIEVPSQAFRIQDPCAVP